MAIASVHGIHAGGPAVRKPEASAHSDMYSVLLVEDEPAAARLLEETFRCTPSRYHISLIWVETLSDAVSCLSATRFDAVLLDLNLSDSRGVATIDAVRNKFPRVPIIVLTCIEDETTAVVAVQKGAQDYLFKGSADSGWIIRSIIYAIERKKVEDAMADTSRLLGMILDTTHLLVAFLDTDFTFIRVNKTFADANGFEAGFFTGKNYFDICPDEKIKQKYLLVLHTGLPHYERGMPLGTAKQEGSGVKYWDWSLVPTKDASGAVNGIVLSLVDVTTQKLAEEQLRHISEHLEKKVRSRAAELLRTNDRLRLEITERNKIQAALSMRQQAIESIYAIETTFSASLESTYDQIALMISNILNVSLVMIGPVEKGKFKIVSELVAKSINHRRMVPISTHPCGIVCKGKKICQFSGELAVMFPKHFRSLAAPYASYAGVPVFCKTGALTGVICVMDTKERTFNRDEVHIIEIFARYIGREIERKIVEEQLRVSNEMQLLGSLVSGVAHEVRNPLNGILAVSEALFQRLGDNPEYITYLELVRKQVNRLSELMKDLLDFGKPLADSEFSPRSIEEVLRSTVDAFNLSSRHKNRPIEVRIGTAATMISANEIKLQQMFINLLENACDHTREGGRISLIAAEPEDSFAVVRIIDEGTGIAKEYLDQVFEPFFTMRRGGTGLGLSIVKRIVEMHGGSIVLQNNVPPPGLTAEVRLPLLQEADSAPCARPGS